MRREKRLKTLDFIADTHGLKEITVFYLDLKKELDYIRKLNKNYD